MTVYVGDLLTASAASVTGKPTPTRTWQWLRGSSAISGATSSTYTVAEADIGENLSVKQIETNIAGSAEATSLTVGPVAVFTPDVLFASGEEGAWYEPSTTTAFKATAVTGGFTDIVPCEFGTGDVANQQCAILLDKSQGAGYSGGSFTGLGSELVDNGEFNTDTVWTKTGNWSISGGQASSGSNSTYDDINQDVGFSAGKFYEFKIDVVSVSATRFSDRFYFSFGDGDTQGSGRSFASVGITSTGSHTILISAGAVDGLLRIYAGGFTSIVVDNISVRELPGNHATQSTASARPILARVPEGGRRNLLEKTEQFDDAVWDNLNTASTVSADATAAPDGQTTADFFKVATTANTDHLLQYSSLISATGQLTFSIRMKPNGLDQIRVALTSGVLDNFVNRAYVNVTLSTKAQVTGTDGTGFSSVTSSVSDADVYGFQTVTLTCNTTQTSVRPYFVMMDGAGGFAFAGTVDTGFYLWGAQLETGSTATAYQKVVDQYDVTEAGVTSLDYLAFDGSDDALLVSSAPLNTALNGSDFAMMCGFSDDGYFTFLNNAVADIHAGIDPSTVNGLRAFYRDTTFQASVLSYEAPSVVYGFFDASAKTATVRGNGVDGVVSSASDNTITTGNLLSIGSLQRPIPIYRGGGFYGGIVLDRAFTAQEITNTEAYLAAKSGVTL